MSNVGRFKSYAQAIGDGSETIPNTPGFCECGCGRKTRIAQRNRRYRNHTLRAGEPMPFFRNHGKRPVARRALFHVNADGRTYFCGRDGRRHYWYRVIAENVIGRELAPNEIVHHINEDCGDDRPENLAVITRADHPRVHYARVPLAVTAIA